MILTSVSGVVSSGARAVGAVTGTEGENSQFAPACRDPAPYRAASTIRA
ncbi:MAG: hypothetical protein KGQ46_12505 [Hyphomicrobiales bacterium]|nr:hypothetical protein [Hyphomicrobiales bacterium]MDE2113818.1 hypothetical protein [Hyphomicrobiales bacterium]